jgi:predicted GH43/DUF377 family glycosyl hydrolase
MIEVLKRGVVLQKRAVPSEEEGVLNPAVILDNGVVHMFYRAVAKGNFSTIGSCQLNGAMNVVNQLDHSVLSPQSADESHGVEDPRIVKIDDIFYLTYTGFDGVNARGKLATSRDLVHFERHGIIVPEVTYDQFHSLAESDRTINEKYRRYNNQNHFSGQIHPDELLWDKNVIFFPRKINNKFTVLHRIRPDIQMFQFYSLYELTHDYWKTYLNEFSSHIVLSPRYDHELSYIGGGCPPIETDAGWLLIYHGVHDTVEGYVYCACACILDIEFPMVELARLPYPLFSPEQPWEVTGAVNNVCFPTGAVVIAGELFIYYGAADHQIACASIHLAELVEEIMKYKIYHENE